KRDLQLPDARDPAQAEAIAQKAADAAIQVLQQRTRTIQNLTDKLAAAEAERDKFKLQVAGYQASALASQEDVKRRQADVEKLRDVLRAETEKNTQLVRDMNQMRDDMVAAQISARSLKDMNVRLEEQIQDLARDLTRMR